MLRFEQALAERARFELAEEREPLAGLANRCLGPLDYLSKRPNSTCDLIKGQGIRGKGRSELMDETLVEQIGVANRPSMNAHFAFGSFPLFSSPSPRAESLQLVDTTFEQAAEGAGFEPARPEVCQFSRLVVSSAHPPLR